MSQSKTLRVTKVNVGIPRIRSGQRFLAYATIELEGAMVVRDIRIIRMSEGRLLVQMPSEKVTLPCRACSRLVPVEYDYCGACGVGQPERVIDRRREDVAFPTNPRQRRVIDDAILAEYERVLAGAANAASGVVAPDGV